LNARARHLPTFQEENMNRLDSRIARELAGWTVIALVCCTVAFFVTQFLRLLPSMTDIGIPALVLGQIMACLSVSVVAWALTPAIIIGAFATAGAMSVRGEFVATDSAGISRFRLLRMPVLMTLFLTVLSAFLWLDGAPAARGVAARFAVEIIPEGLADALDRGVFYTPANGLAFYADTSAGKGHYKGVVLSRTTPDDAVLLVAADARLTFPDHLRRVHLAVTDGELFRFRGDERTTVSFGTLSMAVDLPDAPSSLPFLPAHMSRTTAALRGPACDGASPEQWQFELWRRHARPLSFFLLGITSLLAAFSGNWRRKSMAVLPGIGLFLFVHLCERAAEVLMEQGTISPFQGAFFPLIPVGAILAAGLLVSKYRFGGRAL